MVTKCLSIQKGPSVVNAKGTKCLSMQKGPSVCQYKRDHVFVNAKGTMCSGKRVEASYIVGGVVCLSSAE